MSYDYKLRVASYSGQVRYIIQSFIYYETSGSVFFSKNNTSTPIHARAWKEKALAGYNSQQIPTINNIHKMLIIIISLRWKHFVIISYLYKIPTINEPYNQRKGEIRQTHADILTD